MAQPHINEVHVNRPLTQISIAYRNESYIAPQVFPIVRVNKQSDLYFTYDKEDWFRDEAQVVAPGTAPHEVGYSLSTSTYTAIKYGVRKRIADDERDNADPPLALETEATELATDRIELAMERRVATLVTTAGNWTSSTTLSGADQWSTDTSDPLDDIATAITTVRGLIGRYPNTVVMGAAVWEKLWKHPDIADRAKYTVTGGNLSVDQFAGLFPGMISRVLIGSAIYNTANEDVAVSMSDIWGKNCWVGWVAPRPQLRAPSAGYTFRWGERIVASHRIDDEYADVFDVMEWTDEVVTSADAGYLIASAVA